MATVTGQSGTGNLGSGVLRPDVDPRLYYKNHQRQSILNVILELNTRMVDNPEYDSEEAEHFNLLDTIASTDATPGAADAAKLYAVTDGTKFAVGYKAVIGGTASYVTIVSGNNVTFQPLLSGANMPAVTALDPINISGHAKEEGGAIVASRFTQRDLVSNYIEEFETTYSITNTMLRSAQQTAVTSKHEEEMIKHLQLSRNHQEMTLLAGVKRKLTSGTHPQRFTGGVLSEVTTNSFSFDTGGLTMDNLRSFSRTAFDFGNETKILLVNNSLMNDVEEILQASVQTPRSETIAGVKFMAFESTAGTWLVKRHPYITDALGFEGVYLDPEFIDVCYLKNQALEINPDAVKDGSDKKVTSIKTKFGFQFNFEKTCGLLVRT
jgi:hypothetical protein